MSDSKGPVRLGELRVGQLLGTYGVGSLVDLPHFSVLVMGLEDWDEIHARSLSEPRLLAKVKRRKGLEQVEHLREPPYAKAEDRTRGSAWDPQNLVGVPVAPFPRWLKCPACNRLAPISAGVFRLKTNSFRPHLNTYLHETCPRNRGGRPPSAVPARFLLACPRGHLDDFPWMRFVHKGASSCRGQLELIERGVTGQATDITVECRLCRNRRPMSEAVGGRAASALPQCSGLHPHLRVASREVCDQAPTTITLGGSNSWFALSYSALSIPLRPDPIDRWIDERWNLFAHVRGVGDIEYLARSGQLGRLEAFTPPEVWAALERRRRAAPPEPGDDESLKPPEWRLFVNPRKELNGDDFHVQEIPAPPRFKPVIPQVVLAHRLREVRALVGFTRLSSPGDFGDIDLATSLHPAPLARKDPSFVPAVEVKGEGIFLRFSEERISTWERTPAVEARARQLAQAHRRWRKKRGIDDPDAEFPGIRFLLLHGLAHLLIRQLALECGYAMTSLQERIYCAGGPDSTAARDEDPMAGILLYTAGTDSEGSLGGLVSLGESLKLDGHLHKALDAARLCASDPLCSEHLPDGDGFTLHAAACHACLFLPETSCERGNKYLDRSLLVPTVSHGDLAFFRDAAP